MPDWGTLPRLLQELCDGCPNIRREVYAYDHDGRRSWLCKSCWLERAYPAVRVDLSSVAAACAALASLARKDTHDA
jgi:hypothetical protein